MIVKVISSDTWFYKIDLDDLKELVSSLQGCITLDDCPFHWEPIALSEVNPDDAKATISFRNDYVIYRDENGALIIKALKERREYKKTIIAKTFWAKSTGQAKGTIKNVVEVLEGLLDLI